MTGLKIIKPKFKSYDSVVAITESINFSDFSKSLDPSNVYNHFSIVDIPTDWDGVGMSLPAATVVFDLAGSSLSIRDNGTLNYVVETQNLFSDLTDIIYKYEGIIEKFPGDGISAHFPLIAGKEHSEAIKRAIEAISEMNNLLERKYSLSKRKYRFTLTYGNDTIVTKFGNKKHEELISIGHSVNVAHKLEKEVKKESCYIGMDEECSKYHIFELGWTSEYSLSEDLCRSPYVSEKWFGVKY